MNRQTQPFRIGTRGSALALWQADAVRKALAGAGQGEAEIVVVTTTGDRIQDRALLEAGGKGLFTKEIEDRLAAGTIDLAVHSAKDLQTWLPDGLVVGGYLPRADPRDAFISPLSARVEDLPENATFGSASLRRQALMLRLRPDLKPVLLRGNVPTRIAKVTDGECGATLLALAGLERLGLAAKATAILSLEAFPPACGQGAVAIECRADDRRARAAAEAVNHAQTHQAVTAERAFLAALNGSCRAPIAGHAQIVDGLLHFSGHLLSTDGRTSHADSRTGDPEEAAAIGRSAGLAIRRSAAPEFLKALGIG